MVSKARSASAVAALSIISVIACLCLVLVGYALAQEESKPVIREDYRVTINPVGDARIVDTVKYSADDYKIIKKAVKKNPTFLTRRYTTDTDIGEVVDFETDMNDAEHSIVITFDTPGYAYNMKDYWVAYGFPAKPKDKSGREFTFESTADWNNEFTLFTSLPAQVKTTIELPVGAKKARYDEGEKAIKYQLPATRSLMGFWSENRTTLSIIFGLLTLVCAGLLAFVYTRKPKVKPAYTVAYTPVVTPTVVPPGPTPAARVTPSAPAAQAAPEKEKPVACKNCGAEMAPGKKFCTHCGTHA